MAIVGAQAGSYYEFDAHANAGDVLAFKIHSFEPDVQMQKGIVRPVIADVLVLTGPQAGRLIRQERIIGSGITATLRRRELGDDVIGVMAWGKNGGTSYVQANPPTAEQLQAAIDIFTKCGNDPYSAAAARQTPGPVAATAPAPAAPAAPVAPVVEQPAAPVAPAAPAVDPFAGAAQPAMAGATNGAAAPADTPW